MIYVSAKEETLFVIHPTKVYKNSRESGAFCLLVFLSKISYNMQVTPVFLWLAKHSHIRHLLEFALASQKSTGVF
ncbi:MAG: hypothetical protein COV32_00265 [Candidatus Yonathbacteria bacterium CG10_big_fil_rev_8_21_14_0_10_43_136]|uniref:Uncharacterized protein n=2 Tax=Parcubacteria group TaxID=1794811 RepID=A0A2M7Q5T9_9BACT|nr:MAG: hypothetical protein AUK15_00855 [Candidatus Nomurabacteria bacterium CG2_30_43_9]PIR41012.1 MAG: hypothetical protein COV32_00265 [Candidatus Yonathbacteria bacterium CG10_big_fil_rev_8_21_14_0_10_43_136]PIX57075.1 MAG: hypothetical protein COZ48_02615 [Candidatus Yonathbacteria bacterium CG_4_10_14_3_um_filter_43_12]PIY58791.1 MAG: hypothetical protein COY98_00135 [Candidatus Yonathbacteria bacterium CG_4_10_14_0_8_um_filter_43_17]PJC21785.1 MAG: hypothetical protein CO060_02675 [Cand